MLRNFDKPRSGLYLEIVIVIAIKRGKRSGQGGGFEDLYSLPDPYVSSL